MAELLSNNTDESKDSLFDNMKVKILSGSSDVKVRPLFSYNSKCLILASGSNVKVYSVQSSECLYVLKHHKANVISLQENKDNCLQFFSCSEDGVVVKWDIVEGTFLKSYDLKKPIANFYAPKDSSSFFYTSRYKKENKYGLFSYSKGKERPVLNPVIPHQNTISFGIKGIFVAAVYKNSLKIVEIETKKFVRHYTGVYQLKCVTCHPTDFCVATGDDKGRIIVWSNIFDTTKPIRSIHHWHSLPVADLAFSSQGSYLYSGGGEACLVKWNLFTEEKSVLPRLGAPISWLRNSPDSSCVAVSLGDNSLQIIDPHKNVIGLIQGLTRGFFRGNSKHDVLSTGLIYDPLSKSIVLNGKPGHLQFFSVLDDKHLFNLDISAKNFITNEREHENYNVDVSKAALDARGQWLATVEYWCNGEVSPMIWLKFWEYNSNKLQFVMNTNIYLPHNKEVNCILFRPYDSSDSPPMAVTTSRDCRFKTWSLFDDVGKQSWNCSSQEEYQGNSEAGDASYSEDGSVLAVAFGSVATLWTEDNTQLEAVLPLTDNEGRNIKQLRFGRQSCTHLLVCHDGSRVYVWNLRSMMLSFTINVDIQTIAVDNSSDLMAAFSKDKDGKYQNLYLFKPSSPEPVLFMRNVSREPVVSAVFVPKNTTKGDCTVLEKSQLFFFNEDQCLLTLTDENEEELDNNLKKIKSNLPMTPFGFLQAQQKASDVKEIVPQHIALKERDSEKDSLEYPNPTYMDHFAICSKVLTSMLHTRKQQETVSSENDESKKEAIHEIKPEPMNFEDFMDTTPSLASNELKTCVTDFSFLLKYVDLPIS